MTEQRISTSWGVCRLLGCSRRAPSATLRLPTVACIAARNQTFASYLSLKLSFLPFHADLPCLSSPIMLCSRAFNVRNKVFLTSDCMLDNRKGPGATRRSLQIAAHVDSFRSTPNCSHNQLARLTSLSFVRVGNESRS